MSDASTIDPFALIAALYILVLAAFVGYEVVSKVPTMLHTPLMSGANAIHGVIVVGAMLVAATAEGRCASCWPCVGVILGTINVVGGFVVTDRMLEMFRKRPGGTASRWICSRSSPTSSGWSARVTFILALKFLASPATARRGNQLGAAGMALIIAVDLLHRRRDARQLVDPASSAGWSAR